MRLFLFVLQSTVIVLYTKENTYFSDTSTSQDKKINTNSYKLNQARPKTELRIEWSSSTIMAQAAMEAHKASSGNVTKRLQKELRTLMMSGSPGISAFPDADNMLKWIGTIEGGKGTVYEGLTYKLSLSFPDQYPIEAMRVRFETPCYHPNVDTQGNICLDILKEKWSALYDVRTVLLSIQSLLGEPNIDSPLNEHAAQLWADQDRYKKVLLDHYNRDVKRNNQGSKESFKNL